MDSGFGSQLFEDETLTKKSSSPFAKYSNEELMRFINLNQNTLESQIMKSQHVIEVTTKNNTVRYHV